ncbi:MAG: FAD-dependent oxidoreductase [Gemmatimonadota bacterium]
MGPRPGSHTRPLRVAIVGAGPAGFFTAEALLKQPGLTCSIDLFNRLPTPYGLVREGVAPDHASIKKVTAKFDGVAEMPSVRYFGNVDFGRDVTRADLKARYDQIVYAVGAQSDRQLGIPGEDLAGSHPATIFVGWYNGHPDHADLDFDLSGERAIVVGNGNVAVDVARILVSSPDALARTDIADRALEALRGSRVREVLMLGRRGPAQAKFTSAELKELGKLEGVDVIVDREDLDLDPDSQAALEGDRVAGRNLEILSEFAEREPAAHRRLVLRFLTSPVKILGGDGRVERARLERNRLVPGPDGGLRSEGTGRVEEIAAGLVLRSVGYRGVPVADVPFDAAGGVIPNRAGRVTAEPGGPVLPGEYAVGWIKRGPTGIIGTNKPDAVETVRAMVEDLEAGPEREASGDGGGSIEELLAGRGVAFVTWEDWKKLDEEERRRGRAQGRPRVKITNVDEMLELIGR